MKRLLVVANVAKEHVNKFHLPFIKHFSELGWEVDVACVHDEDVPYCHRQYDMVYKRNTLSVATIRGIFQLRRILKETHYDVIHCHTPTGGVVARVAAMGLRNKPVVLYTAHGFHFFRGASLLSWVLFYPIEKFLSRFTDCLITINTEDYELACKRFHAKKHCYIHGAGVNLSRYKQDDEERRMEARRRIRKELSLSEDDIVLTYVAELIPNKNQLSLIDMLKVLIQQHPNVKLLLVGPDHHGGQVQRKAEAMGLGQHVICTGWRSDIADLLAASDFAVPASKREGLGLNIIEAMAGKVPVVAYDNRGHRDIIRQGENGYIVPNGDHEVMASTISMLIENSNKCKEVITQAFFSINQYDTIAVLDNLQKVYAEVVIDCQK